MEAALRAIADPRRRRILELVADEERSAGEIASRFEITRPAISQHLTVLKGAGLLSERREGTRRLYSVRPEGLDELREFLDGFWGGGLDRLKAAAEQAERESR
jgi:DNA-binding transcriptional ArsR family regulator